MAANRPVLIVGDSQALGTPGRALAALVNGPVERLAVEGRGPADWLAFDRTTLEAAIRGAAGARPEVVFWFGTNDPPSQTEAAFRQLRELSPDAWLIGPPSYADPTRDDWSRQITAQGRRIFGTHFVSSRTITDTKEGRAADGIHFTEEGGRAWAAEIASRISFQRAVPALGTVFGILSGAALMFWWSSR